MFCHTMYIKDGKRVSEDISSFVTAYDYSMEYIDANIMDIINNNYIYFINTKRNRRLILTFFDKNERTRYYVYYCRAKYLQRYIAYAKIQDLNKDIVGIHIDGFMPQTMDGIACTRYDIEKPEKFYRGDYVEYFCDGFFYKGVITSKNDIPVVDRSLYNDAEYPEVCHYHDNHYIIEDLFNENEYFRRTSFYPLTLLFDDYDFGDIIHGSDIKLIERGKYIKYVEELEAKCLEEREKENKM